MIQGYSEYVFETNARFVYVQGVYTASLDISVIPYVDELNVWYLNRVYVSKDIRNQGIGTQLMRNMISFADSKNCTIICDPNPYDGTVSMEFLYKWYTSFGFQDECSLPSRLIYVPNKERERINE